MSEDVKVQIELNKQRAEIGLRDLARQLNSADDLYNRLKRSGVIWGDEVKDATQKVRDELKKLGAVTASATDKAIKGNKNYAKSFDAITKKVKDTQNAIQSIGKNFLPKINASQVPATASLRNDNEKRRQQYMSKLQQSYQKEQAALQKHNQHLESLRRSALAKQQAQLQARIQARQQYNAAERQALKNQENAVNSFWQRMNSSVNAKETADKLKSIKQLYINLQKTSAAGLSSTASLGGMRANNALLKEQAALARMAAKEQKNKSAADRDVAQSQTTLAAAAKRLTTVGLAQASAANRLSTSWKLVKQEFRETISIANIAQTSMRGFLAVLGRMGQGFINLFKAAPQLSSEMLGFRNALALVTGNQKEASTLLNTAVGIAEKLKLSIVDVTRQYSKFTNAATIAGLSVKDATSTFEDFAVAARVLNLNQERTAGMFLALEQMISKGTVSMEELRRQLGEHIPGAMNLAAQAMGYGTDELAKFIKEVANGNVNSVELVTKLSKLVRMRTEPQLASSLRKFSAELQAAINALDLLRVKIGDALTPVLGMLLRGFTWFIEKLTDIIPLTTILGDESNRLTTSLDSLEQTATKVTSTFTSLGVGETQVAEASRDLTGEINILEKDMNAMDMAGVALIGTVGASGLGGAFAALKKGFDWLKAGLLAFVRPFVPLVNAVKTAVKFFGAAGLAGAVTKLGASLSGFIVYLKSAATGLALVALANPFTAIAASIGAASVALASFIDDADELDNVLKDVEGSLTAVNNESKSIITTAEEIMSKMADAGQAALAAEAAMLSTRQQQLQNNIDSLIAMKEHIEDQGTAWDWINKKFGLVTDNSARMTSQISGINQEVYALRLEMGKNVLETERLEEEATKVNTQLALAVDLMKQFAAQVETKSLEIDLAVAKGSITDVQGKIKQINLDAQEEANKLTLEAGGANKVDEEALAQIYQQRDLRKAIVNATEARKAQDAANKAYASTVKKLLTDLNQQEESITDNIQALKLRNEQVGMNERQLAESNAQAEIAAITEKVLALETRATTTAMLERVAVMKNQIVTLANLKQQNIDLVEAEKKRKEALKERQQLEEKGRELLRETLSLEEKFQLRVRELIPALRAAGATNAQITDVMKQQWAKLVDESNTGLKSIEAITEEVAKGMQNSFSDFFFDFMNGEFDNLADSFTNMLNRMVADAAAAQLSQYIMGVGQSGGGGGIFDTIVSTFASSVLGVPAMPSIGSAGGTSIGSFTAGTAGMGMTSPEFASLGFATGGQFKVGGSGGTDSQVVAFKASPNERVTVETPAQQKESKNSGTVQNISVNFNVTSPNADSFNASRGQMEMQLRDMVKRAGKYT